MHISPRRPVEDRRPLSAEHEVSLRYVQLQPLEFEHDFGGRIYIEVKRLDLLRHYPRNVDCLYEWSYMHLL